MTRTPTLTLTHHATLVVGERALVLTALEETVGVAFRTVPDQDILFVERDALTIDDARELSLRAPQKPVSRDTMLFIIASHSVNVEAQNALLKLTEDPPPHARFVFVLPPSAPLLPTLRSRFALVRLDTRTEDASVRLESVAKALKHIARVVKDKDDASMEALLRESEARVHNAQKKGRSAAALVLARRYIESRGSSPKMLLEHLAIAEREG